jgi:hypothetical protein
MKKTFLVLLTLFMVAMLSALQVTYSDSNAGQDDGPTVSSVTFDVLPGTTITDVQITASIGSNCPSWYEFNLDLAGTAYTGLCNFTDQSYADLNGAAVNGQTVTITSVDTDVYSDGVTLALSVTVVYDPPAGAPGEVTNPSPADNATGIALSGNATWDFGIDTDTYDLWFGPAGAMVQVVTGGTAGATGTYAFSGLSYSTEYEWRVTSINSAKATTVGPVWSFTTMLDPAMVQIGAGVTTGQHLPIEPYYGYTYSQSIYLASDFGTPGADKRIEKIWYNYSGSFADADNDLWVVYMGTTALTNLDGGYIAIGSLSQVFDGNVGLSAVSGTGWIEIVLDTPFPYNPSTDGNLVIAVDENSPSYSVDADEFLCDLDARANVSRHYYNDSTNPDPAAPPAGTASAYYPNTRFLFGDMPAMAEPTALTVSNIGILSADLDWTENAGLSLWDIAYGSVGFDPDTEGTTISATSTKPYSLSGLTIDTTYQWYVRSNDGTKATTAWSNASTFSTHDGLAVNPDPANTAIAIDLDYLTLTWDAIIDADSYAISIGTTTGGTELANKVACASNTYTYGSNWDYDTTYYWTVYTYYDDGSKNSRATIEVQGTEWTFTTIPEPYTLPYSCDATDVTGWIIQTNGGANNWGLSSTGNAGGTSPEFMLNYASADPGTSRLISPPFDTSGLTSLPVIFNHFLNDYGVGCSITLQTSTDLNTWTDENWTVDTGSGDVGPEVVSTTVTNNLGATTYVAWTVYGNHYQFDQWYLDNIMVGNQSYVGAYLYISEVCDNPTGESDRTGFIELYNPNTYPIDLGGLLIVQGNIVADNFVAGATNYAIPSNSVISSGGFFIIANGIDLATFNAAWRTSVAASDFADGHVSLGITSGYAYGLDDGSKAIVQYSPEVPANERATQPIPGTWTEGGTPDNGAPGGFGGDEGPLPVVLATFTAQFVNEDLTIFWATHSEVNNSGWNVYRSTEDSYDTAEKLNSNMIQGMGTSYELTEYEFVDATEVQNHTTYYYWLESVDYAGHSAFYGSISIDVEQQDNPEAPEIPIVLGLHQNYPNPFNPDTKIRFAVEESGKVELTVYNAKGQKVTTIYNGEVETDKYYDFVWNGKDKTGKDVASGVYMYKLETANKTYMKKMLLVK